MFNQRSIKALINVVAVWASFWVVGMALCSNQFIFHLYESPFKTPMGYRLATAIHQIQCSENKTVLLLGASTVREGFDTDIMNENQDSFQFVNGGTSGGSILTLPAMVEMVRMSRIHPDCIVLGINARMLISRSSNVQDHGYTDFMHLFSGVSLSFLDGMKEKERDATFKHIVSNTAWPFSMQARRLNQLFRYSLFNLNSAMFGDSALSIDDYMRRRGELLPSPRFIYTSDVPLSKEKMESYETKYLNEGMFDPSSYAAPLHLELLRKALLDLSLSCNQLIVIEMPESTYSNQNFSILAKPQMVDVLSEFSDQVKYIDHSSYFSDHRFRDISHMLVSTRAEYSENMASKLPEVLNEAVGIK